MKNRRDFLKNVFGASGTDDGGTIAPASATCPYECRKNSARAQRAYELYLQKYRNMPAAYPEVIISQRTLFQLQEIYTRALGDLWSSAIQLQNYLFVEGLSAPRSSGSTSTQINPPNATTGGNE